MLPSVEGQYPCASADIALERKPVRAVADSANFLIANGNKTPLQHSCFIYHIYNIYPESKSNLILTACIDKFLQIVVFCFNLQLAVHATEAW